MWDKFQGSNGAIQKYYFLRKLLERGKHHPQIILSMASEYAFVVLVLNHIGVGITTGMVVALTVVILTAILVVGYVDVYLDIARKNSSYDSRFSPERQKLYAQIDSIVKKLGIKGDMKWMKK